jgi:NADPH2:quinone reductase
MKVIAYKKSHKLEDFNFSIQELSMPELREFDILVGIKAISINPVDYKIRSSRSSTNERPVVIGWDAAGVVEAVGAKAHGFKVGDEVYYAGDLTRDGSYAELQAVDSRIVALKPKTLSFTEAAALPLTSLTAYESLFGSKFKTEDTSKVLIIGGAGGVGSVAIQLLRAKSKAQVITTASRPDTVEWVKKMGADIVIDYKNNLKVELDKNKLGEVDIVFGTIHSEQYLKVIPTILRPFGHFILIDDPESLNIKDFKSKALSVHWELMFTKSLFSYELESQGKILSEVASLVDAGKMKTTMNKVLKGFTTENIREAHTILESGKSIGKIVVDFS